MDNKTVASKYVYDYTDLENAGEHSNMKTLWSKMFNYTKPYLFRAGLGLLFALPVGAMEAVIALALRPYTDAVMVDKNAEVAFWVPIIIILFTLIQGILNYLSAYLNAWASTKIILDLIRDLYKKLMNMESSYFDQKSSGLILTRFSGDANAASIGFLGQIKILVTKSASAIALICVLLYNSWLLALGAVGILALAALPVKIVRKKLTFLSNKGIKVGGEITTSYNEAVGGNKVIKGYNLEQNRLNVFNKSMSEIFSLSMKGAQVGALMTPFMYFLASLGMAFTLGMGSHLMVTKAITPGQFTSFLFALAMLYTPFKTLGNTYSDMKNSLLAMDRVFKIADYEAKIKDKENAIKFNEIPQKIEFKNVWFEYLKDCPVLKNINLEVKAGETVAFVGNSGGGKSTIAHLLPRFYDIKSGSITINGYDIKDLTLESLRANISFVFQDNFLFNGTIKENVLLGKENASDKEVNLALERAFLKDFIESLPDGLNTKIGERGVMLSGGQKQRVAIARAFIKNAPIVVLDEATSALDNKSEQIVQMALNKLMEDRTVFVIAHRLSTIQGADKIIVLNQGEIVETGNHATLINVENGQYKSLYNSQFKVED
ncbi:MAG: ABC transporter transmembrane domain-containing protein, partial [Candidatus Gastranaerophilales bacterium]|nr:ABC transporter transmembrane domain-containing protein [Candidatus Gastranaerophilales bacterium]